jgi:NitT/TauT family transport system substrate-binding protein
VWGTASIIARDASLKTLADLKGRSIGLPFKGSPNDVQLQRILKKKSISEQITLEYMPHLLASATMLQGDLDAIVVPEPIASRLVADQQGIRIIELADEEIRLFKSEAPSPMVSLFINKNIRSEKKALLPELERKLQAILAELAAHPEQIAGKYAGLYNVSENVLREGLRFTRFDLPDQKITRYRMEAFLKAANIELPGADYYMP